MRFALLTIRRKFAENAWLGLVLWAICAGQAAWADKARYLDLARAGWSYELRESFLRRDLSIPVHINGRDLAGAAICLLGERPDAATSATLETFRALLNHVYGKPVPMRHAGDHAAGCGTGRIVLLRLYSGFPPNQALTADLDWMNRTFALGLPRGRFYAATSPAMAQTFFGKRGQGTHIMVQQHAPGRPQPLAQAFHRSILIEELYQAFTFGMDVLLLDRSTRFASKLQEIPLNLRRLPWNSAAFMRALLGSNPKGLCQFDVFMLHALALSPVQQTIDPDFITFIDAEFETLVKLARDTWQNPDYRAVQDPACAKL